MVGKRFEHPNINPQGTERTLYRTPQTIFTPQFQIDFNTTLAKGNISETADQPSVSCVALYFCIHPDRL